MNGPYSYVSRYRDIGQGAEIFALAGPMLPISATTYGPRYNVGGSINPILGAQAYSPKSGPNADLRANGVYLAGDLSLQALVEFNAKKG